MTSAVTNTIIGEEKEQEVCHVKNSPEPTPRVWQAMDEALDAIRTARAVCEYAANEIPHCESDTAESARRAWQAQEKILSSMIEKILGPE